MRTPVHGCGVPTAAEPRSAPWPRQGYVGAGGRASEPLVDRPFLGVRPGPILRAQKNVGWARALRSRARAHVRHGITRIGQPISVPRGTCTCRYRQIFSFAGIVRSNVVRIGIGSSRVCSCRSISRLVTTCELSILQPRTRLCSPSKFGRGT